MSVCDLAIETFNARSMDIRRMTMNATQTLRVISIVMVTTVVAGCSSSGTLQMKQASTQTISPGKSVALSVEALLPPDAGSELREEAALVFRSKQRIPNRRI